MSESLTEALFGESATNLPPVAFFLVQDRATCAAGMSDADGDGIPDVYEAMNGTNPYVPDAAFVPRIAVGPGGDLATLAEALAESEAYDIISIAPGVYDSTTPIQMPAHPVMVVCETGYAMLRSSAVPGVVILADGQGPHTLFRGLNVVLAATSGYQAAFWCGGNMPWSGVSSTATFENVRIRALYPGVLHYGWHFYRSGAQTAVISNCTINAAGSTEICGIYSFEGPSVEVRDCTFANFPEYSAVYTQSVPANYGGMDGPAQILIEGSVFDESFTDGYPLARFEQGTNYVVTMRRCVVPTEMESPHVPDVAEELFVTNAQTTWCGLAPPGSAAHSLGVGSRTPWPLDSLADSDGDGLYDEDEALVYETDPWLADSDGDGLPDGDEIFNGTSPCSLESFYREITVVMRSDDGLDSTTNYLAWGEAGVGMEPNLVAAAGLADSTNVFVVASTNSGIRVSAYRDLDRDGAYGPECDILLSASVTPLRAVDRFVFAFGDVDGDGVADAQERADGTDPYDAGNFRICAVLDVRLHDAADITNHLLVAGVEEAAFCGSAPSPLTVCGVATNGNVAVEIYRDVDGNGECTAGTDVIYLAALSKTDNGRTVVVDLGDADGDGLGDVVELAEGTDPNDAGSLCYDMEAFFVDVFSTTNLLSARATFGTNVVASAAEVTNREWHVDFGHCVAAAGERAEVLFWDDVDGNGRPGRGEASVSVLLAPAGHENVVTNRLDYGGFDRDGDRIPDWWEELHADAGLSSTNHADALADYDGDGLMNVHEFWAGCDPAVPDGSNTVLSVVSRSIDDRLRGRMASDETKCVYLNYSETGPLEYILSANTNCWACGIDFSCASPWNSMAGENRKHAGTAISRRHILLANHFRFSGHEIYFVTTNGNIHTNFVVAAPGQDVEDIAVGILQFDLPEDVSVAKILPSNWHDYIKDGYALPVFSLDQDEHAIVHDIQSIDDHVMGRRPEDVRLDFSEDIVQGDSGNPRFFVVHDDVILLSAFHYGGNGYGASIASFRVELQQMMDALSLQQGLDAEDYQLEVFDFGGFAPCEN